MNTEFDDMSVALLELMRQFRQELSESGKNASGRLSESIEGDVTDFASTFIGGEVLADSYWYYINQGRGPTGSGAQKGSPSLYEAIQQWIEDKGVTVQGSVKSLAYLIARKIHREGYKGVPVFDNALQRFLDTTEAFNDMSTHIAMSFLGEKTTVIE